MLAIFATAGHLSVTSFAIGPFIIVPFGLPLSSLSTTAELSSNFILMPSGLLYSFFCLTMIANTTCFLMSGLPLTTEAITRSPTPQLDFLPFTVFEPTTVNTLISFAPELSHVSILLPTGRDFVMFALTGCIFIHTHSHNQLSNSCSFLISKEHYLLFNYLCSLLYHSLACSFALGSSLGSSLNLFFDSSMASLLSLNPFWVPSISTITKFFVLLNGLHSDTLTKSPSFAPRQAGLWAFILFVFFSYLMYFLILLV